jgi:hypothetical protein
MSNQQNRMSKIDELNALIRNTITTGKITSLNLDKTTAEYCLMTGLSERKVKEYLKILSLTKRIKIEKGEIYAN